jgi:hypothetical protein
MALFHSVEQRGAVIQIHAWLSSAARSALGQPHGRSIRLFLRTTQDKLKTLLDQRRKRSATPRSFLTGSFQELLV